MPKPNVQTSSGTRRSCRECGTRLVGRSDKQFCADFCRNAFHNRENREVNALLRRGNQVLRRNYRILQWAVGQGDSFRIRPEQLEARGFNFLWYTRLLGSGLRKPAYQIYDLVYSMQEDGSYKVHPGTLDLFPVIGT